MAWSADFRVEIDASSEDYHSANIRQCLNQTGSKLTVVLHAEGSLCDRPVKARVKEGVGVGPLQALELHENRALKQLCFGAYRGAIYALKTRQTSKKDQDLALILTCFLFKSACSSRYCSSAHAPRRVHKTSLIDVKG